MHQRQYEFAPVWVLRNVVSALDFHCWMLCVILAPRAAGMSSIRLVERSIDTILASFLLLLCAPHADWKCNSQLWLWKSRPPKQDRSKYK